MSDVINLGSAQGFPGANVPLIDQRGTITQPWLQFLLALWRRTGSTSGTIPGGNTVNSDPLTVYDATSPEEAAGQADLFAGAMTWPEDIQAAGQADLFAGAMAWPEDIQAPGGDPLASLAAFSDVPDVSLAAFDFLPVEEEPAPIRGAPLWLPTVGASPYSFVSDRRQAVIVSGGTVTAIAFSRDGTTFYSVGLTAGMFLLETSDVLRVTYTVVPTVFVAAPF